MLEVDIEQNIYEFRSSAKGKQWICGILGTLVAGVLNFFLPRDWAVDLRMAVTLVAILPFAFWGFFSFQGYESAALLALIKENLTTAPHLLYGDEAEDLGIGEAVRRYNKERASGPEQQTEQED